MQLNAGQLGRQGCALRLLAGLFDCLVRRCQVLEFLLNGGDVGINRFIEQTGLAGIELFTATAELPAFEDRHLMGQLVDLGLAVKNLAVFAGDGLVETGDLSVTAGDLRDQIAGEFAQLLCVQNGQGFGGDNHERKCARACENDLFVHPPIDAKAHRDQELHHRNNAALANARPWQAQHQGI